MQNVPPKAVIRIARRTVLGVGCANVLYMGVAPYSLVTLHM